MKDILRDKLEVPAAYPPIYPPITATKVFPINKGIIQWIKFYWKPDNEHLVIDITSRDVILPDRQGTKPEIILLGVKSQGGSLEFKGINYQGNSNHEVWIDVCVES